MKKHGFTLIEVLAIIIILGVLASITYPIVKNTIEKNRQKGFASSVDGVVRTTQMYIASNAISEDILMSYNDEKIKTENNNFISGTVKYLNGEINIRGFSDGQYCANGVPGNIIIEKRSCTAEENASVPIDSCFEFDVNSRTITRYNYTDLGCPKKGVIIPEKINGVPIEHIGEHAFIKGVNLANYMILGTKILNDNTLLYDIMENIGTTTTPEIIKEMPHTQAEKDCVYASGHTNEQPLSYYIDESSAYIYCYFDPSSYKNYKNYGGIESIDLSYAKSLKTIDKYAFANGELRYITFGNLPKLEIIDTMAFYDCNITGKLDLSELTGLKTIERQAFYDNSINEITLPSDVRIIGSAAFYGNDLNKVTIGPNIISIGDNAFQTNNTGTMTIDRAANTVTGAKWGANNFTINWTGSN